MAVTHSGVDDDVATLASYVPDPIGSWQPPIDRPSWTQIDGTLVSADISGFTALSERLAGLGREGAEELTNILNDCFERMIEAVHVQAGNILKFGGDALLILFSGADHALRACRSATAMRSIVARPLVGVTAGRVQLAISQGMHSGRFTVYSLQAGHTDLVITGRSASETVDCEAAANPGEILLSGATAALLPPDLTGDAFEQGRRLLVGTPVFAASVAEPATQTDAHPARYLPDAQREQILVGAPAEHRRVTVAFVKFSHTDHLEDEGPDVVTQHLQRLATIVADAARENGVHWMATDIVADGGKIILAAGAPTASEDDEDRMLRTVRTIIEQTVDFDVHIGVNCGPVFVGDLGSSRRRTFTIMGDAVNLAARLMAKAQTGQVVASRALTDRARTRYELDTLPPFFVKGKSEPIDASVLGRLQGRNASGDGHVLTLVGRQRELAMLDRVVHGAGSGHGGVVEISGDAGTGKTRLVDEIRVRSGLPHVTVICGQYARSAPYFVVRLLLRTLSGSALVTPSDEAGALLTAWVQRVAPGQLPWLPLVGLVADAHVAPTAEADRIAPAFRRERTHRAIADLLAAAVRVPSLLVIEDVQWMDDASRDALGTVLGDITERPWAVLMTRRPGAPLFGALPPDVHTAIDLEPLGAVAALELAAAAAGEDATLLPDEWDRLVEHSGGNPLFVIELVRSAALQGHGDALPDSIEALVTSRLDQLTAADRLLLREASVLGTVIDTEILAITLGDDSVRSPERWRELEVFVTKVNGLLQFRHGLHRHVAYEGMSYRRRREAHRRVGDAIEARAGQRFDEWAELLSTHFDAAGARDRAWHYSRIAADRSRAKNANVEAAEFYRRALDNGSVIRVSKPELVIVAEALGDVSELAGRYDDAARAYRRAVSLKVTGADRVRLLHKEGVLRERIGRYSEALRWYRRGLNLLERDQTATSAAALRAQLALAYAGVRYRQGQYGELVRWAEEAATSAALAGDRASLAHAYYLLDLGVFSLGRSDVTDYRTLALPIYEDLHDDVGLCNVWNNLGIVDYHAGHWSKALDAYSTACLAAERAGDVVGVATGQNNIGEILCDQGRIDEAVPLFRRALRVFRSAGYPAGVGVAMANLGWAEVLAGTVAEGMDHLERAVAAFAELGASAFVFSTRVRVVEALVVGHRCAEALDLASSLIGRLADEGDDKPKVQLQRARGWALLALGNIDEAGRAIDDSSARGGDARYERACNDLCRANIAALNGNADAAFELQGRANTTFDELGVISLPRVPWTRSASTE